MDPLSRLSPGAADTGPLAVSDLDAIAEISRGNREMFEVIVRRYNQLLYRVGLSYLRDHSLVEDAMQNAYVKAFLHLRDFEHGATFSTWMTRIMINECLMMLRRQKSRPEAPLDLLAFEPAMVAGSGAAANNDEPVRSASDQLSSKELKSLLEEAVSELPRKYRTVYMLREVQQLSVAETAEALGVSAASVKVDLHRARERLKAALLKSAAGAELFAYPAVFCNAMTRRAMQAITGLT